MLDNEKVDAVVQSSFLCVLLSLPQNVDVDYYASQFDIPYINLAYGRNHGRR